MDNDVREELRNLRKDIQQLSNSFQDFRLMAASELKLLKYKSGIINGIVSLIGGALASVGVVLAFFKN